MLLIETLTEVLFTYSIHLFIQHMPVIANFYNIY